MKQDFLDFVNELIKAAPEKAQELMTEDIKAYLDMMANDKDVKPILTDNGKLILNFLQENIETRLWKSKDVAEQLGISSRSASGSMRKLVNDGFCDKIGQNPVCYCLTEKEKILKL